MRDVLWHGDVCPSVRVSVSHSFPHFSPTCFDILSWNFVCHFLLMKMISTFLLCALIYWAEIVYVTSYEHSMKLECRQFPSIFIGVIPLLELWILVIHSFPHFLSWNFAHGFVILTVLHIKFECFLICVNFYTPVFRPVVLWYGDVRPGPGLRPPVSILFSNMLWHIELKFCMWLCFMNLRSRVSVVNFR